MSYSSENLRKKLRYFFQRVENGAVIELISAATFLDAVFSSLNQAPTPLSYTFELPLQRTRRTGSLGMILLDIFILLPRRTTSDDNNNDEDKHV